ncbi:hypothetical protein BU24DRAFT_428825 [Aaosphaeria arxii CBS 175.79]|uniref:Zn(2)-C6 fungal-type domain-containing protein n=1 Tax=Aaosphaeria arxii CBS 175.79 TaxID=1450172 RepID=A0A6A5X8B0_9PLEO|nr:uncharacterized protein BU24DRAFT_428825 [Aaosphaeria arxii CBS 175.79]KAF2009285.1 hypothetical protein BU24DRAFT_428825 [Aaosphaeria arxii CBS 175.79]
MIALQVCLTCKGRKKRCDKQLPQCSFCKQKGIYCSYDYGREIDAYAPAQPASGSFVASHHSSAPENHRGNGRDTACTSSPYQSTAFGSPSDALPLDTRLSIEVDLIVRPTGQSPDMVERRYFQGLHLWVPFMCPSRFRNERLMAVSTPTAEFSLLLLSMYLITHDPPELSKTSIRRGDLHLHAKTLFSQISLLRRPSIRLIQAGILIAIYEYAHGDPDSALASIDLCARMACKAGFNRHSADKGVNQAWNTWWALRIFERIFYCETALTTLPLITSAPDETDILPYEVSSLDCGEDLIAKPGCRVWPINTAGVGCFGRAAQATYLLDQVLQAMKIGEASVRLVRLIALDSELRRLLSVTMSACHGKRGGHCGAVGTSIRALFMLHEHNLQNDILPTTQCVNYPQAALDTVVQMVVDISRSHRGIDGADIDIVSPICNYVVRHTLTLHYQRRYSDSEAWFDDSDALRESLAKLSRRWQIT